MMALFTVVTELMKKIVVSSIPLQTAKGLFTFFSESWKCLDEEFKCAEGSKCIPKSWKCDGRSQCKNATDERDCHPTHCLPEQYHCTEQDTCIPLSWRCDGKSDCMGGDDEKLCGNKLP